MSYTVATDNVKVKKLVGTGRAKESNEGGGSERPRHNGKRPTADDESDALRAGAVPSLTLRRAYEHPQTFYGDELRAALPPLLDSTTAAQVLGVNVRTVTRMCEQGKLKAIKVQSLWRINRDHLLAFAGLD